MKIVQEKDSAQKEKICVAGITMAFQCNNSWLSEQLVQRYDTYMAKGPAQLIAQIDWAPSSGAARMPDPEMLFDGGILHFSEAGYEGYVDTRCGQARLSLDSTSPIEAVDYFLRVVYARLIFRSGGLLLHGAGIIRNERGYIFFGHSGSGKTTVARLSSDDLVLNDDLVVLVWESGVWKVYSTPFWSPEQVKPNKHSDVLVAMFRLVQDEKVYLEKLSSGKSLAELVSNTPIIAADPSSSKDLMKRISDILASVPVYNLHFLPDLTFWQVIEERGRQN